MVKKLVLLVVGVLMAALFAGCGNDAPKEQAGKKIHVCPTRRPAQPAMVTGLRRQQGTR